MHSYPIDRPILFQGEMVRAVLADTDPKTQTRRIIKPQPAWIADPCVLFKTKDADPKGIIKCPYGKPGDRLWVRENFRVLGAALAWESSTEAGLDFSEGAALVRYQADDFEHNIDGLIIRDDGVDESKQAQRYMQRGCWIPSIHMPRWASRITLEITDLRVQRLHDITEEDAQAEGVYNAAGFGTLDISARVLFKDLWVRINGQESWDENPWLWALTFKRIMEGGHA